MHYSFDIDDAEKYGLAEAVMLSNLKYWLRHNTANKKNFHDGDVWTYNSKRAYSLLFPFWSEAQVKRVLKSLLNQGVIKTGNYNKSAYDRTLWYAVTDPKTLELCISQDEPMGQTQLTNGSDEINQAIPNVNTVLNLIKNKSEAKIRFLPPTHDEIDDEIKLKNYEDSDTDDFFNYYSSNGWKVGKNKMISWQHALAGWNSRQRKFNEKRNADQGALNWEVEW